MTACVMIRTGWLTLDNPRHIEGLVCVAYFWCPVVCCYCQKQLYAVTHRNVKNARLSGVWTLNSWQLCDQSACLYVDIRLHYVVFIVRFGPYPSPPICYYYFAKLGQFKQ